MPFCLCARMLSPFSYGQLFETMDCSTPGSSVNGILWARRLEWVAKPSSRGSSLPRDQTLISNVTYIARQFFTTRTTWEAYHAASCSLLEDVTPKAANTILKTSVQFSSSVVSDSLQPHGLQHARPPCPSPTPRICSNSCPSSQ